MSQASTSRAPLIGITADLSGVPANGTNFAQEPTLFLPQRYCRVIQEAGGIPLILPPIAFQSGLRRILQRLDGALISGGNFDIHPSYYGEKPIRALGAIKADRTEFELELVDLALNEDLPLLGICGGAQAINVALSLSARPNRGSDSMSVIGLLARISSIVDGHAARLPRASPLDRADGSLQP